MIIRIYKTTFEAAHYIESHPQCGNLHGHTYRLTVSIQYNNENWVDFHDIKNTVDSFINTKYDHKNLGNATAEEISIRICNELESCNLTGSIELFETDKFGVKRYFGTSS